jgi:hypothetical protein
MMLPFQLLKYSVQVDDEVSTIYIYIYIYKLGYGALQSTRALCVLCSIFHFKSEMIDPNRSI